MHRITFWLDDEGDARQVSVACLDSDWEPWAEVTEAVGPFDELLEAVQTAMERSHALGGWRAHQTALQLD